MRRIIGIDPGLTGGVACVDVRDGEINAVRGWPTPVCSAVRNRKPTRDYDVRAMYKLLMDLICPVDRRSCLIVLERASTRPGQAAQAVLRTGEGYGIWRGLIAAFPVEVRHVTPQVWKKQASLLHAPKQASVLRVKDRFPSLAALTATQHGIADAALIAATAV